MSNLRADVLLHPMRLRIVQALVERPMTAGGLKMVLGDVAQATLYRHINALEEAGLIEVVEQRQVRGGVERTYQVVADAVSLGGDDLADVGVDDHFRYFGTFVGTLLADYAAYLETGTRDFEADRVGYRQAPLWLSDQEFDELMIELAGVVEERLGQEPGPGRRRRLLTTIVMPDDRVSTEGDDSATSG